MTHPAIIEQRRREREQARQSQGPALRIPAPWAPRPEPRQEGPCAAPESTVDFSVDFTI